MIILNDQLKEYLSLKYHIDKKLIYHFGFDDKTQKFKMVYHNDSNTLIKYVNYGDMRNYLLRLKLQKIITSIKIKKQKLGKNENI